MYKSDLEQVKLKVNDILVKIKPDTLNIELLDTIDLINNLNFESFLLIRLIVELEDAFGISLDDDFIALANIRFYKNIYTGIYQIISKNEVDTNDEI